MTKLRRKLDTPESREFWAGVDRVAAEVATWPAWKRAGVNAATERTQELHVQRSQHAISRHLREIAELPLRTMELVPTTLRKLGFAREADAYAGLVEEWRRVAERSER